MAKAPASDTIMPAEKMRPLLAMSKKEPVFAAIGLSAEGDGLLLLDKKASPRKVMSMLRANAEKGKLKLVGSSLRYGRAEVDVDYDPSMVRLFINKDAPGQMRIKLTEVVKRILYQKVEINVDPSLDEEDDEAPETPPAPLDPAKLTAQMRELIGQFPAAIAADPARKPDLTKRATDALNTIKAGNLEEAAMLIEQLRGVLAPPPGKTTPPHNDWAAARAAWQDANDAVNDQINALRAALLERSRSDDEDAELFAEALAEIAEGGLNAVTEDHRVKLMAALMELGTTLPEGAGGKALAQVTAFQAFLQSSEKIEVCDANPFGVPVSIRATLGPALQRLAAALDPAG